MVGITSREEGLGFFLPKTTMETRLTFETKDIAARILVAFRLRHGDTRLASPFFLVELVQLLLQDFQLGVGIIQVGREAVDLVTFRQRRSRSTFSKEIACIAPIGMFLLTSAQQWQL